jgi:hypothetical protein
MAERYTRAADRQRLASEGAQKLLPDQTQNEKRPHRSVGDGYFDLFGLTSRMRVKAFE